ncbi:MAG: hypothetical protein ACK55Z_34360, partial [bacterium]
MNGSANLRRPRTAPTFVGLLPVQEFVRKSATAFVSDFGWPNRNLLASWRPDTCFGYLFTQLVRKLLTWRRYG